MKKLKSEFYSDTAPVSLVATDPDDQKVYGFLCLSNGPPTTFNYDPIEFGQNESAPPGIPHWEEWIKKSYTISSDVSV
jgi:hypothetical protein